VLFDPKEGEFAPESFRDHYEEALIEVIKKKQAHEPVRKSAGRPSAPKNVVNLMDALRRSIANDDAKPARTKAAKPKKRVVGQKSKMGSVIRPYFFSSRERHRNGII
jgi:DNA end-binding protein Ku